MKPAGIARGRRAWLTHFRDSLEGMHLLETRDAWVLSSYEPGPTKAVAAYVSATRERILRLLEGIARFSPDEKSIFVALDSQEQYYQYVANYFPEDGEFAFSGGMYVNHGCPHFITVKQELYRLEPVIAHEMTHSAVAHLKLPLWLDEGNSLSYDLATQIVGLAAFDIDLGRHASLALNVAPQAGWSPDPDTWKNAPRQR